MVTQEKKLLHWDKHILQYKHIGRKLIANLFRISQTTEKLKKIKSKNKETATHTYYQVGNKVRKAIKDIGGTMPEDLPTPKKSIKQIEEKHMKKLKEKAKQNKIILDE